jgi:preprotein translocase subunit SecF
LAALSLFFFGGEVIHDFAFALVIGISVGTYSSIFVASPIVVLWEGRSGKINA